MRRHTFVPALLLAATAATAQDQAPSQRTAGLPRFGAPVVKLTSIRAQPAVMLGGRGGWNVSRSVTLGFGLYGTLSQVDGASGVISAAGVPLDVKLESFGVEFEYALHPVARTHFTLGALLGGAAIRYVKDGTDEQDGETDFVLLLEPGVGIERAVAGWVHLHLAVSYRVVSGVEQRGLTTSDAHGPAAVFALKLGCF
jgi:hypothetical protein